MKIAGKVPGQKTDSFKLERGEDVFSIRFRAMSIGLYEQIDHDLGGSPRPPEGGFIREGRGFLRDPETNAAIREVNDRDPDYVKASATHNWLLNAAMVFHCLDDDTVVFDVEDPGVNARDVKFYQAILDELNEAGFSAGDIGNMVQFITRLSEITPERVKEVKDSF